MIEDESIGKVVNLKELLTEISNAKRNKITLSEVKMKLSLRR